MVSCAGYTMHQPCISLGTSPSLRLGSWYGLGTELIGRGYGKEEEYLFSSFFNLHTMHCYMNYSIPDLHYNVRVIDRKMLDIFLIPSLIS